MIITAVLLRYHEDGQQPGGENPRVYLRIYRYLADSKFVFSLWSMAFPNKMNAINRTTDSTGQCITNIFTETCIVCTFVSTDSVHSLTKSPLF